MRLIICACIVTMLSLRAQCQDIVYPKDDEARPATSRKPITTAAPARPELRRGRCPENMIWYPEKEEEEGNKTAGACDCRPKYLYYPRNDSCFEAYKRGPCPPRRYFVLPEGATAARCERNPCATDGLVPFNDTCSAVRKATGPCAPDGILDVNEATFRLECVTTEAVEFAIIDAPNRGDGCVNGSRRNSLGMCRKAL